MNRFMKIAKRIFKPQNNELEGKNGEKELSFFQELEDSFYEKYPEQWEEETHFAIGNSFVSILEGKTDRVSIPKYKGEKATYNWIERGKRRLWIVGNTFEVCEKINSSSEDKSLGGNKRQFSQTIGPGKSLGSIKLIEIIPKEVENILVFEKI